MHESVPLSTWINFGLLLALLIYFGRKPVRRFLGARHDNLKSAVEEAELFRARVEAMVREYEGKLARLDREITAILEDARQAGEEERRRILERAEETAERIRTETLRRTEKELERMKGKLEAEVLDLAVARAMELLRHRITEDDHRIFANGLIARLEEGNGRGG